MVGIAVVRANIVLSYLTSFQIATEIQNVHFSVFKGCTLPCSVLPEHCVAPQHCGGGTLHYGLFGCARCH